MKCQRVENFLAAWSFSPGDREIISPLGFYESPRAGTYCAPYSDYLALRLISMGAQLQGTLHNPLPKVILDIPRKRDPYDHQVVGQNLLLENDKFVLAWQVGTGKSMCPTTVASHLFDQKICDRSLIITPKTVIPEWADSHIPFDSEYDVVRLDGTKIQRLKKLKQGMTDNKKFFVINYEAIKPLLPDLKASGLLTPRSILILDEGHRVVYPGQKTIFPSVKKLIDHSGVARIWALTGTPVGRKLEKIYGLASLICPEAFGGPTWPEYCRFKDKYCLQNMYGSVTGYQNVDEYMARLSMFMHRLEKKDVLKDLPEQTRTVITLDLPPKLRKTYDVFSQQVKRGSDWLYELTVGGQDLCSTEMAGAAVAIARQIVNNWVYLGTGKDRVWHELYPDLPDQKMDAIIQKLKDTGAPAIIWYAHHGDRVVISRALKKAGITFVVADGTLTSKQIEENIKTFQARGEVQVIAGHPACIGTGNTLHRAELVFYYNAIFDPRQREQSEGRAHRAGLKHPLSMFCFVYRDTVEESMEKGRDNDIEFSDMVLNRRLTPEQAKAILQGRAFDLVGAGQLRQ